MSEATPPPCPTNCRWAGTHPDEHNLFLTIEDGGISAVRDTIHTLDLAADCEGGFEWEEFEQFVSSHNWRDPAAVTDLASWVVRKIGSRVDGQHRQATTPETLQVRRLEVVDHTGTARVVLSADHADDAAGITLHGPDGGPMAEFTGNETGPQMTFVGGYGNAGLQLGTTWPTEQSLTEPDAFICMMNGLGDLASEFRILAGNDDPAQR